MGKLVTLISILIFVDLAFLITGTLDVSSNTSIVTGALLNPSAIKTSLFFLVFLGAVGIGSLVSQSSVSSGIVTRGLDVLAFTAMAVAMAAFIGDFLTIYNTLNVSNPVLSKVIIAPLTMVLVITIAEWLRVKD